MMKALLLLALLVAGCATHPVPPAAAPTTGMTADQARREERARLEERDSQAVAVVQAWLAHYPQMTPDAWRSEFALFLERYRGTKPRADHVAAAEQRVTAWAEGRTEDAKAQTATAMVEAQKYVDDLATERAARIAAEGREKESREASDKRIRALEQQISDIEDSIWQRVRFWTVLALYAAATVCLLLGGLRIKAAIATGLDVVAAAKAALVWIGFAGTLFTLARVISAPWFLYACGGVVVLIAGYVGYLVWKAQKGEQARRALQPVVAAIDQVYDDAAGTVKDDLDNRIFAPLSAAMKDVPGAKAYIHEVRAGS